MSILSNIINTYLAPGKVFEAVKNFNLKNTLVPLLILAVLGVISFWVIQDLATEVGFDTAVEKIENNTRIDDEQKEEIIAKMDERMSGTNYMGWIFSFLGNPISVFFMALIALIFLYSCMG